MPAIAKVLVALAAILLLTRVRVQLGFALVIGGLGLNLWAGAGPAACFARLAAALGSADVWLMVLMAAGVVEFGRYITEDDTADTLLGATRAWGGRHGRTWSAVMVPAVVGLIPMPGGALFSAPFVERAVGATDQANDWKAMVNYWFRHVWEYWWPLYPGVILAMSIMPVSPLAFFVVQIPFSVVAAATGYWLLVHPHLAALAEDTTVGGRVDRARLLQTLLPLAVVIAAMLVLPPAGRLLWPHGQDQYVKMVAMVAGLGGGVLTIAWTERRRGRHRVMFRSLGTWKAQSILLVIFGVMVFKHLIEAAGVIGLASQEMQQARLPVALVVAALPFLAGLVTGVAAGFVGASFPLVAALLVNPALGMEPLSGLVLAFGFGYMGMMLSPVHLCLLVSCDYFSAPLWRTYRYLVPCAAVLLGYTIAAYLVIALAFGR